ncbi:MAG: hypothetical protein AB1696_19430 [Planctomycetota bacterium]
MEEETGRGNYFERRKKPWRWTWKTTIVRSIPPIFLCLVFLFIIPNFASMYADLGIVLPNMTIFLCNFSMLLRRYFVLAPVFVAVAVGLDYGGYRIFRAWLGDAASHLWMGFIVICYGVYLAFCVIALFLPLIEDLTIVAPAPAPATKPASPPSGIFPLLR